MLAEWRSPRFARYVAPTVLQAIDLPEPTMINGVKQIPMAGTALNDTFEDAKAHERHTTRYFEIAGNRGIYRATPTGAVTPKHPLRLAGPTRHGLAVPTSCWWG